ncbi:28S ribosomal protein S18c, mitochondrial [Pectinophora gossypiella]|uniref:28S ribosomal protein S18c, mitochondrial n=1 Tax=Pectinophora gossypiella TaxID=13191 RepID=UPI00214F04E6|nr:28S ribosomal protein S18c, mitochondrial [Pectinophora gossypiella]
MALLKTIFPRQIFVNTHRVIVSNIRQIATEQNTSSDEPVDIANPFKKETRQCILCKLKISPNYKNYRLLSQFQSPYTGRIYGRHITGLCKSKQALVEAEIIKAQNCGYMPYFYKDKAYLKDPKLFDPENPIRSHRF